MNLKPCFLFLEALNTSQIYQITSKVCFVKGLVNYIKYWHIFLTLNHICPNKFEGIKNKGLGGVRYPSKIPNPFKFLPFVSFIKKKILNKVIKSHPSHSLDSPLLPLRLSKLLPNVSTNVPLSSNCSNFVKKQVLRMEHKFIYWNLCLN